MAFNLPVQNYFRRSIGPSEWVRPNDWPSITDTAGEVHFLMSDLGDSSCSLRTTFSRTSGSQNMVIDWGDNTTTTISSTVSTTTNKTYTPGTGTPCSLGYTTFKIRVYFTGTGVSVLSQCQITSILISGNTFSTQSVGVLEAYYGDGTVNATVPTFESQAGNSSSVSFFNYLNYVKLPATVTWTSQMGNMFRGCQRLVKVVMPTSGSSLSTFANTFNDCRSLIEVIIPSNATGITSFTGCFTGCYELRRVEFPTSLNSVTTMTTVFSQCWSLRNITFPSMNSCTSFNNTFQSCNQLEWIKFTSLPTVASTIDFSSFVANSANLQTVIFPSTATASSTYNFSGAFQSCFNLKTIVFPSNMNASNFSTAFQQCYNLTTCILPSDLSSCTTFQNCFISCNNLLSITIPTGRITGMSLAATFTNCYRLETVTLSNSSIFTSLAQTFSGCTSLKTINWTPTAQNSLTTMDSTFANCILLEGINIPTSMTGLNTLSQTFNNCISLKTLTFPSSLNAVTTMIQTFFNCSSLQSVTLPTSMSACNNFSTTFSGCRSIISITLPNIVNAFTSTFSAAFNNCGMLKTLVFPGSAQLSLAFDITSIFNNCPNLVTITNFDKIGSLTATPVMSAGTNQYARLTSISFVAPLAQLGLNGASITTGRADVQSVRLLNIATGQWTGSSPQITVAYTNMSTANLIQLFNDMAAGPSVVSKTINITGAVGVGGLTAGDRSIITNKGWTITG
jgi:hypothetical protein